MEAYSEYGFTPCFTFTFGQQGINRPDAYSAESVAEILDNIGEDSDELVYPVFGEKDNLTHPNIVFLQLESFFDVNTIIGSEYSADPTRNFNRLCSRFPSGLLYVPTIGGGTANTEFEVITGLNLDFFGAGEYPYNTILQQKACETLAYDLKDYGYSSTAMHNNSATFYGRNVVYPRLGFDRFVSLEYMLDVKYNELGWAKDAVLTEEILAALESTDSRDMVFCVAVESHGKYGEEYEPAPGDVEVLSLPESIPLAPFQNFVTALSGPDALLGSLMRALVHFDEPTIVVVYPTAWARTCSSSWASPAAWSPSCTSPWIPPSPGTNTCSSWRCWNTTCSTATRPPTRASIPTRPPTCAWAAGTSLSPARTWSTADCW